MDGPEESEEAEGAADEGATLIDACGGIGKAITGHANPNKGKYLIHAMTLFLSFSTITEPMPLKKIRLYFTASRYH